MSFSAENRINMSNKILVYSIITSFLIISSYAFASEITHEEKNGIVIIEVENNTIPPGWKIDKNIQGYTGTGAITSTKAGWHVNNAGSLSYTFKINKPGKYLLQSRLRSGSKGHDLNDCWVNFVNGKPYMGKKKLKKGTWYKFFENAKKIWPNWGWGGVIDHKGINLAYVEYKKPGEYTIQINYRAPQFSIDRIALSHTNVNKKKVHDVKLKETLVSKTLAGSVEKK